MAYLMTYGEVQDFYRRVCAALRADLAPLGCAFDSKEHFVEPWMHTATPTTWAFLPVPNGGKPRLVGYVRFDKCMVSPARYFGMYSALTGGRGGNQTIRDLDWVRRIFLLNVRAELRLIGEAEATAEGATLGVSRELAYILERRP